MLQLNEIIVAIRKEVVIPEDIKKTLNKIAKPIEIEEVLYWYNKSIEWYWKDSENIALVDFINHINTDEKDFWNNLNNACLYRIEGVVDENFIINETVGDINKFKIYPEVEIKFPGVNSEVNIKSLITTLAFDSANDEIKQSIFNTVEVFTNDDETEYTEEFQIVFNRWYDYYFNQFKQYNLNIN